MILWWGINGLSLAPPVGCPSYLLVAVLKMVLVWSWTRDVALGTSCFKLGAEKPANLLNFRTKILFGCACDIEKKTHQTVVFCWCAAHAQQLFSYAGVTPTTLLWIPTQTLKHFILFADPSGSRQENRWKCDVLLASRTCATTVFCGVGNSYIL